MATRSLGTLTLDLIAKIGGFTQGMDQASRVADKRMREIERRSYAFGKTIGSSIRAAGAEFLAFAGVTLTIGAALEKLKGAIDLADETRDLSIRLGVSTQALSDLRYAAQQTGTDMDTLGKGMKILAKNAELALNPKSQQAGIFKALGVSVVDAKGKIKDLDVLIGNVADKFKVLEDGTTKAALAQALFGKSGLDLTEFLNSGSQGLTDYGAKLRELGGEITPEAAANADEFNDKLHDLQTAAGGMALQISGDLLPQMTDLVQSMIDFTSDAKNAKDASDDIAGAFNAVAGGASLIVKGMKIISATVRGVTSDLTALILTLQAVQKAETLQFNDAADLMKRAGIARQMAAEQSGVIGDILSGGDGHPHSPSGQRAVHIITGSSGQLPDSAFRTPAGDSASKAEIAALQKRLQAALNGSSPTGGGHKGKSDAERDAEKVKAAIEQMTKAQQDWENEIAKTGNPIADEYADRLNQITEEGKQFAKEGVPADKIQAFTDKMKELAGTLRDADIVKFQKEFDDETATMAAQMQGPAAAALEQYRQDVEKLNDELRAGDITLEKYNARIAVLDQLRDSPATSVLSDLQDQIKLLGMTNEQQEIYNNLKQAGVSATSDFGQQIVGATQALQDMKEQTEFIDDLKSSLSDAFVDFVDGAKSAKDAFGDFADHVYQTALRWLADKAIQALFNGFGNNSAGATGGGGGGFNWGALFGSIFGGGRASGGATTGGKLYEVGEYNRPEVFTSRGKQYLIPGNAGAVAPMASAQNRGGNVTNYFSLSKRNDNRSERQIAQATDRAIRSAR